MSMDSNKFKYYVMRKGSTLGRVATELGINPATLSRKLSGESDFSRCEIQKIREYLGLNLAEAEEIFFNQNIA